MKLSLGSQTGRFSVKNKNKSAKPRSNKIDFSIFGKHATISDCEKYRYKLRRSLTTSASDVKEKIMVFIMLNPSTADSYTDDNTIRKCIKFALRENCTDLYVVNLFAYRTPHIGNLLSAFQHNINIVGDRNDEYIENLIGVALKKKHEVVLVAAWGSYNNWKISNPNLIQYRAAQIYDKYKTRLFCLKLNADGSPQHPLYISNDTPLKPFKMKIQQEFLNPFEYDGKKVAFGRV